MLLTSRYMYVNVRMYVSAKYDTLQKPKNVPLPIACTLTYLNIHTPMYVSIENYVCNT